MDGEPLSQKVNEYTAKEYWVTAALWQNSLGGKTYEIGIRSKALNGDFTLLQSEKYNFQTVQEMAEIVCLALNHGYSPDWCQEMLT